jgi:hypothetical protein
MTHAQTSPMTRPSTRHGGRPHVRAAPRPTGRTSRSRGAPPGSAGKPTAVRRFAKRPVVTHAQTSPMTRPSTRGEGDVPRARRDAPVPRADWRSSVGLLDDSPRRTATTGVPAAGGGGHAIVAPRGDVPWARRDAPVPRADWRSAVGLLDDSPRTTATTGMPAAGGGQAIVAPRGDVPRARRDAPVPARIGARPWACSMTRRAARLRLACPRRAGGRPSLLREATS